MIPEKPPAALPGAKLLKSLTNRFANLSRDPPELKADAICPEERGANRIRNLLSKWHTLPAEALLMVTNCLGF